MASSNQNLTSAQNDLFVWLKEYIEEFKHSPSIRQMMQAMNLNSPAPIQSRLKHLQEKGYISWQQGKARTLSLVQETFNKIPIMGTIAAGGLVDTFPDCQEELDINSILEKKSIFALTVNGDSMIDACIADGDVVLMEKVNEVSSIRNGEIVSALVPGAGTTLKYFLKKNNKITLEAANPAYDPIILNADQVTIQGKFFALWRKP